MQDDDHNGYDCGGGVVETIRGAGGTIE